MLFNRPDCYGLNNHFCGVSAETLNNNIQPRIPSRGQIVSRLLMAVLALATLVCGKPANATGTLTATPSSTSFGTIAVGTKSTQTVQLKNTGSTTLTISSATISGSGFTMNALSIPLVVGGAGP